MPRSLFALLLALVLTAVSNVGAQTRWTLTETLRIGGADEGPTSFSWVKSIAVDARGRVHIYEHSTQDIRVFGPDGKYVKTIGRVGSGPGELRNAEGIAFARDGKLWMRDAANGRFSRFDADGAFEKSWPMGYCYSQGAWEPQFDDKGRILDIDCLVEAGQGRRRGILGYHTDMSKVDTIGIAPECGTREFAESGTWITRHTNGMSYRSIPWAPRAHWALGPAGEVWCVSNSARFEVMRISVGGRDTVRIAKSTPAVPVTPFERDSVIAIIEEKGPTGLDFGRIPKTKPMIDRLNVDPEGRLWVRHTDARGAIVFDVFGADGRHLATAELGALKVSVYAPFTVAGNQVYAVVLDEDDVPWVVRYAIGR